MDINFIKWMVEKAEGFEWIEPDRIGMPHGTWTVNDSCKDNPSWNFLIYPLLLQGAIEGVNRDEGYLVYQDFSELRIEHNTNCNVDEYYNFEDYGSIDQAKEQTHNQGMQQAQQQMQPQQQPQQRQQQQQAQQQQQPQHPDQMIDQWNKQPQQQQEQPANIQDDFDDDIPF